MRTHHHAAEALKAALGPRQPKLAIILGSGLGDLADLIEDATAVPYDSIPDFPQSTVAGHAGRFIIGTLGGKDVIAMQGRLHSYEGHSFSDLALPIRAMRAVGIETLFISNAAGSMHAHMPPGSLMAISDHINWSGFNPLIGPNDDSIGPRFVNMSDAYSRDLRDKLHAVAKAQGITLHEGVYFWYTGPNFETPAEIRAFKMLGADAVGMSTAPDCIAAVHCGMKVVAVSAITNLAAGMSDEILSHEHTLTQSRKAAANFITLVTEFTRAL